MRRLCRYARADLRKAITTKRFILAKLKALDAQELRVKGYYDWITATRYAGRVFPGSEWWLVDCSSHEGGHGHFVYNTQGSGAGGWLQFMSGTFYSYAPTAFSEAKRRGYELPRSAMNWFNPLGQAITGGYMITHHHGSHWAGGYCKTSL